MMYFSLKSFFRFLDIIFLLIFSHRLEKKIEVVICIHKQENETSDVPGNNIFVLVVSSLVRTNKLYFFVYFLWCRIFILMFTQIFVWNNYSISKMSENYLQKTFFIIEFLNRTAILLNLIHLGVLYFKSTDWPRHDLKIARMG